MALFLSMSGAEGGCGWWAEECLAVSSLLAYMEEFTGVFLGLSSCRAKGSVGLESFCHKKSQAFILYIYYKKGIQTRLD